jgi:hypothetical protein
MQIAGSKCKVCKRNIVLSNEGKCCVRCGIVVHSACEPQARCAVCDEPYQAYERPGVDPLNEAILPRALRLARSGGPTLAIVLTIVLAGLALLFWCAIQFALSHGNTR